MKKHFTGVGITPKTKERFDLVQKYLGMPSADYLINKLLDFFMKRKRINNYKLNKFKKMKDDN